MANQEFAEFLDTTDEWIVSNTGIRFRHIADADQAASDLGYEAARKALRNAGVSPKEIDLIVVATSTADYRGFPSTACIIQGRLGARNAGAFDITAACTGFVYGLGTTSRFIEAGAAKKILLVGAETNSKILNWKDRKTCVLFGDGAGAVLITSCEDGRGIIDSVLKSDGSKSSVLSIPGGSRHPIRSGIITEEYCLSMKGRPVYLFAVRVIEETINQLLKRNRINLEDVNYIVPHQANIRIIEAAAKRLGVSKDKFFTNIHEVANTSAASIPLALNDLVKEGKLKSGDLIMTVGFGGGLTYGGNLIRW